jgi:AcrR family transcriptional regulator
MPKPTFEHLPSDKRQRVIDVAIDEFAERPYALASVTQIAERAGVAKGSMYQYFEDKRDLFLFLVDYAAQAQLAHLAALVPPDPDIDTFTLLRWQMSASVRVGVALPQMTQLLQRAFADDHPFRDEVGRRTGAAGAQHLQVLVERGIARGEIDSAFDVELAASLIRGVLGELRGLLLRRAGVSLASAAADVERISGADVEGIYDEVLRFIERGLRPAGAGAGAIERGTSQ